MVGVDFSARMLGHGLRKVRTAGLDSRVHLAQGDATCMPLPDEAFEAAAVAFGIRNVVDPEQACREFHRVLRPGGRLAVLEFGSPAVPGLRTLYLWYFRHVLPRIGRLVSRHDEAYSYLPASVIEFPSGERFVEILRRAGFATVRFETFTFGVVYLYLATKDDPPPVAR